MISSRISPLVLGNLLGLAMETSSYFGSARHGYTYYTWIKYHLSILLAYLAREVRHHTCTLYKIYMPYEETTEQFTCSITYQLSTNQNLPHANLQQCNATTHPHHQSPARTVLASPVTSHKPKAPSLKKSSTSYAPLSLASPHTPLLPIRLATIP